MSVTPISSYKTHCRPTKYVLLQKVPIVQTEQRKKELLKIAYVHSEFKINIRVLQKFKSTTCKMKCKLDGNPLCFFKNNLSTF